MQFARMSLVLKEGKEEEEGMNDREEEMKQVHVYHSLLLQV